MKSNMLPGGRWKRNQAPREIHGFRLFDSIIYNNIPAYISGRRSTGYFTIKDCEGHVVSSSVSYKALALTRHNNTLLAFTRRNGTLLIPPPFENGGILKTIS